MPTTKNEFSIVVRSHARAHLINDMSLKVLAAQEDLDLERCLWLSINSDEIDQYEEALDGFPCAGIIPCLKKGGHHSVNSTIDHFKPGDKVVFMDDDTMELWEWYKSPAQPKVKRPLTCLGRYLNDAFETLDRGYAKAFHFYNMPNAFWKKDRAFKEFRPHHFGGDFWGGYIDPKMMKVNQAHEDDRLRGSRYYDRDGGVLIYSWLGQKGGRVLEGGMQQGDRGTAETRAEETKKLIFHLWNTEPLLRKYHREPEYRKKYNYWSVRMKSITQIQKIRPFTHLQWSNYFQQEPNK